MTRKINITILFTSILLLVYIAAWIIQNNLFLNWDVSQLLYATEQMLHGGNYIDAFFIPNTPMILYLYSPTIVLMRFGINIILGFRISVFILTSISLLFNFILLKKIIEKNEKILLFTFFTIIAACFLILPIYDFGQRDSLFYILILPYGLLIATRLKNININSKIAIIIGVFAGLGFNIKPQFLITFLLLETFYCNYKRNILSWFRVETITVFLTTIAYILSVLIFFPEYITVMIPFLVKNYYNRLNITYLSIITYYPMVYCLLSTSLFIVTIRQNKYILITTIFFIMYVGITLSFILQKMFWYYHLIPVFSIALTINSWLLLIAFKNQCKIRDNFFILIPGILFSLFLFNNTTTMWEAFVFHRLSIFIYSGSLFLILLSLCNPHEIIKNILFTACFVVIGIYTMYLISHISWYPYALLLLMFLFCICLSICASKKEKSTPTIFYYGFLTFVIFAFPVFFIQSGYYSSKDFKSHKLKTLINFVHSLKKHNLSLYALTTNGAVTTPLVHYTDIKLPQRIDTIWMVYNLNNILHEKGMNYVENYIKNNKDKYFFINIIAEDLRLKKPDYVLVDNERLPWKDQHDQIDFIFYFSKNSAFANEWKNYVFFTKLVDKGYNYSIFQRKSQLEGLTSYDKR